MERRNFIIDFLFWILAFLIGYTGKKEDKNLQYVSVKTQPYNAKGDGITDDTQSIQNILNDTAAKGGGIVYIPAGKYRITSITIPLGVSILGEYAFNPNRSNGTWFYCVGTNKPAITAVNNNLIQNIGFYYPNQVWDTMNAKPLIYYPASIYVQTDATKVNVKDVFFQNTFVAIDANRHHETLTLQNINGYAIYQGVICDNTTDVDRYSNVHFNSNAWDQTSSKPSNVRDFYQWTRTNGTAFTIQRADWLEMDKCFAWGYRYGVLLQDSRDAKLSNKSPSAINISDCGFDMCGCCIWMKNGWGVQIDGCFFTAYNAYEGGVANSTAAVLIDGGEDVTITNSRWWGTDVHCLLLANENGIVENCKFWEYGLRAVSEGQHYRAIVLLSGTQQISNNVFNGKSNSRVFGIIINSVNVIATISQNTFRDFVQSPINTVDNAANFNIDRNIFKNVVLAEGAVRVYLGANQTNYQYDSTKDLVVN